MVEKKRSYRHMLGVLTSEVRSSGPPFTCETPLQLLALSYPNGAMAAVRAYMTCRFPDDLDACSRQPSFIAEWLVSTQGRSQDNGSHSQPGIRNLAAMEGGSRR